MSVKVLSAASTSKLIDLATVKDRLGITDGSQDTRIGNLIAEASSAIEEYIGRPLARQQYLEAVTGNSRSRIALSRLPVDRDSVTLTIDDTADTDFTVEDWNAGHLWRDGGWLPNQIARSLAERDEENIAVTYKAGYVLPDMIVAFPVSTVVTAGTWVRPTAAVKDFLMECTTAGTTGASEPTWPTTAGSTVTSGTAVYTARHASELPRQIISAVWLVVQELHVSLTRVSKLSAIESDGQAIRYFAGGGDSSGGITNSVARMLEPWRFGA